MAPLCFSKDTKKLIKLEGGRQKERKTNIDTDISINQI